MRLPERNRSEIFSEIDAFSANAEAAEFRLHGFATYSSQASEHSFVVIQY
jgi:hypothetical protein